MATNGEHENPTVAITFDPETTAVNVNWNTSAKSLEFVLMMLEGARRAVEEHRSAVRMHQAMKGIQVADNLDAFKGKPGMPLMLKRPQ